MLLTDLREFFTAHRAHGVFVSELGDVTVNGYRLHVVCHCGVVFERWITQEEATEDLIGLARQN